MKIQIFSAKGVKGEAISLPKELEAKANLNLLSQAVHVYRERSHTGLSSTKTRTEINRTTKKWYKQKGTGGARHGARSAPIFVGGGVAHGPRPLKRELTLSTGMKKKALQVALTLKVKEGKVVAVNNLSDLAKTKEVQNIVTKVTDIKKPKVTFVLEKMGSKAFRNIANSKTVQFKDLNAYDVFLGGILIFDANVFGKKEAKPKVAKTKKTK